MNRRKLSTLLAATVLIAIPGPGIRAQTPSTAPPPVCDAQRYSLLRRIPEESRTYEEQKELEQLQRACADAATGAMLRNAKPANATTKAEPPAPPALAAQVPLRHGFWFSGGLGYGSLGCQDCRYRLDGLSGAISLGGTLSQHVQLGAGTNGWTRSENGVTVTAGTVTAQIRVYPSERGHFFFLGGLGPASLTGSIQGFGSATETGLGAVIGVGYDFRVGRNLSLTPFYNGIAMSNENGDANFGQIGLAITTH